MNKLFDLTEKVAVVTGGYSHLGAGIVTGLLEYGATVIVAGRNEEKFLAEFPNREKEKLFFKSLDISDSSEKIAEVFGEIRETFGSVDIVFNNAHFARGKGQENISDDDWAYTLEGVLGSVHKCIKAVIPIMKEQSSGKIINISSMYGVVSPNFDRLYKGSDCEKYTNPPHYGAGKAAVIQLTKYYAVYLGPDNIQVNTITPGPFSKIKVQEENPIFIERLKENNPLRKLGTPKDLAGVSVLLSSGSSDFITGQNIIVDGGWTIW